MPPPYEADRAYSTGEAKTIAVSGTLGLDYCGGTFVRTREEDWAGCTPPFDAGWILGNTFAPFARHCEDFGFNGGHSINLQAFGSIFSITTGGVDRDPPNADYAWRTALFHNGTMVQHFDDPAEVGLTSTTPFRVTGDFNVSFLAEKWIYEIDDFNLAGGPFGGQGVRPRNIYSGGLFILWRIMSDITSVFAGHTETISKDALDGLDNWFALSPTSPETPVRVPIVQTGYAADINLGLFPMFTVTSTYDTRGKKGYVYDLLPEADGKDAIAYGEQLASLSIGSTDGALDGFLSDDQWISVGSDPCGISTDGGTAKIRDFSIVGNQTFFSFKQPNNPDVYTVQTGYHPEFVRSWKAYHLTRLTLNGTVRDWEKSLNDFKAALTEDRFICDEEVTVTSAATFSGGYLSSARRITAPSIDISDTGPYGDREPPYPMVLRYGPTWPSLKLDHAATLLVEDFKHSGTGTNDWQGSGVRTLEGDNLRVDGGTGVFISKTLKNDYVDMVANISTWWAAHKNALTALGGPLAASVKAWGDTTGNQYRIGRKLLIDSDEYNWSGFRYAYLKAKASAACNVTLTVTYREYNVTDVPSNADCHDYKVVFTVPVGTTETETEIDLVSQPTVFEIGFPQYLSGYQQGMRYVTHLKIEIPDGITLHFYGITLKQKNAPTLEVHHAPADPGVIGAVVDGKQGLFLSTGVRRYSSSSIDSRWGWPGIRLMDYSSIGFLVSGFYTLTLSELATELSLQAGWTGTEISKPTQGRPNYATDLLETFDASSGGQLISKRHFGQAEVSFNTTDSLDLFLNLGNQIDALVFDPDTFRPASTTVHLSGKDPHTLTENQTDDGHSSAIGAVELQMTRGEFYTLSTNAGAYSYDGNSLMGTLDFPNLFGKGEAVSGKPSLVTTRDLETYIAIIKDNAVQVGRMRGAETDFTFFHVGTGLTNPDIAKCETRTDFPIYITGHLEGPPKKVLLLKNRHYGEPSDTWKIKVIGEGSNARIEVEESLGLLFISYWKAGNLVLRKSSDEGVTWLKFDSSGTEEAIIKTGAPETTFDMGFLSTKDRTLIGVYQDTDGTLVTLKSANLGETWS